MRDFVREKTPLAIIRGVALSILAAVAIAYSLTSELALVASTRGDIAAKRASVIEQNEGRTSLKTSRSLFASTESRVNSSPFRS
jgi:CHASE1-domain containing sensor protein